MKIKITYDGEYPNLCGGQLKVYLDDTEYVFPRYCLSSGGSIWFNDEWEEQMERGEWSITEWPDNFPEKYKKEVEEAVNAEVPHGCCGGCV